MLRMTRPPSRSTSECAAHIIVCAVLSRRSASARANSHTSSAFLACTPPRSSRSFHNSSYLSRPGPVHITTGSHRLHGRRKP